MRTALIIQLIKKDKNHCRHYRRIVGAIVVYDITDRKSFENVQAWMDEVRCYSDCEVEFLLIGNKKDLDYKREILMMDAVKFAGKNDMKFGETSAKGNMGAKELENIKNIFKSFLLGKPP